MVDFRINPMEKSFVLHWRASRKLKMWKKIRHFFDLLAFLKFADLGQLSLARLLFFTFKKGQRSLAFSSILPTPVWIQI